MENERWKGSVILNTVAELPITPCDEAGAQNRPGISPRQGKARDVTKMRLQNSPVR